MKILLIEPDQKTASSICRALAEEHYSIEIVDNGEEGLALAKTGTFDLIILDVLLPRTDGWTVISELRNGGNNTLALFLSNCSEVQDRIRGLNVGADGYLSKPFETSELVARARALLRRHNVNFATTICIDTLEIDLPSHRVHRAGKRLDLTPKEYKLLHLFAVHRGEILSRKVIAQAVWNSQFDTKNTKVEVQINRLRNKVDAGQTKKLIRTVRGVGYILLNEGEDS
jgi:two-component system copper resistance phosphate regulon response regulator CusR